jgi:hypothetical protein
MLADAQAAEVELDLCFSPLSAATFPNRVSCSEGSLTIFRKMASGREPVLGDEQTGVLVVAFPIVRVQSQALFGIGHFESGCPWRREASASSTVRSDGALPSALSSATSSSLNAARGRISLGGGGTGPAPGWKVRHRRGFRAEDSAMAGGSI